MCVSLISSLKKTGLQLPLTSALRFSGVSMQKARETCVMTRVIICFPRQTVSLYVFTHLSLSLSHSMYISIYPSMYVSIHPSFCLYIYIAFYISIYLYTIYDLIYYVCLRGIYLRMRFEILTAVTIKIILF
jgi:hypothetical protein